MIAFPEAWRAVVDVGWEEWCMCCVCVCGVEGREGEEGRGEGGGRRYMYCPFSVGGNA